MAGLNPENFRPHSKQIVNGNETTEAVEEREYWNHDDPRDLRRECCRNSTDCRGTV